MKNLKHLLLPSIVGVVLFSSCSQQKDFTCTCSDIIGFCGTPYDLPINGKTKHDAKKECNSYEVSDGIRHAECSLK